MTTRGKLEEVESVHVANVNAGQVAGRLSKVLVGVTVDKQRAPAEHKAGVSHLALTSAGALLGASAVEISRGTSSLKSREESGGLINVEVVDDEWELGDIIDSVTTGPDERRAARDSIHT